MKRNRAARTGDYLILTLVLVLTAVSGYLVPSLHIDNSLDIFMPKGNEVVRINKENEKIFGSQDVVMVALSSRYESVLSSKNIQVIRELTEEIKKLPHVDDVLSLANADYIINSGWGMEVVNLFPKDMPEGQAVAELKRRLADWKDVYGRTLISEDQRMSSIIVKLEPNGSESGWNGAVYRGVREITARYGDSGFEFSFAGEPVLMQETTNSIVKDLSLLIPISALIICLIMYLTFHRLEGVVFLLISLAAAVILTMGVMSLTGATFTMASMLIPILLLVVGSAYCIHIMAHFYDAVAGESGFISPDRVGQILSGVIREIRISVMMAGFTTVAGFISLTSSPLGPFKSFALLTALGVSFTLLSAFILLPALLRIRYRKGIPAGRLRRNAGDQIRSNPRDGGRIFRLIALVVRKGKIPVFLSIGVLLLITVSLLPGINTGLNFINFFPESSSLRQDLDKVNEKLSGTGTITVRFDAPKKGDILDPQFLKKVEQFSGYMRSEYGSITTVSSLVPQIKRMNKLMNFDSVPYDTPEPATDNFDSFFDSATSGKTSLTGSSAETPESGEDADNRSAGPAGSGAPSVSVSSMKGGLTYEQTAEYLESALLDAGLKPDAESVVRNFLKAGNYRGEAFDEIPTDPAKYGLKSQQELSNLLAQYMLLYSGSLDGIINDGIEPDKMLLTMAVNDEALAAVESILDDTRAYWDRNLLKDWKYHIAGSTTLIYRVSSLITKSQIISILIALVIIYVILTIIYRSLTAGIIGLIPVFAGLTGIFFTMSTAGFNLDFITALLGSLAIGIGVDYAIHFISAYRRSVLRGENDHLDYVYRTTGRAIFFNAASVAAGFLALVLSSLIPIRQMGLMFALAMLFSGAASLILVPMALEFFRPRFLYKGAGERKKPAFQTENKNPEVE